LTLDSKLSKMQTHDKFPIDKTPTVDFSKVPSPCFVLEERLLRYNLQVLRHVMDEADCEIICALKGFSMFSTFGLVREYLPGATASSLNEARLTYEEMGVKAHLCAPGYREEDWEGFVKYCSHITFNSMNQWNQYKERALKAGISCALRINPQYSEVETDLYNPCIPGSRLGITADHLGDKLPEGIEGIHFHTLCENDSFSLERTFKAVEDRFGSLLHQAKWLNLGGGHHITRKDYDVDHLINLIKYIKKTYNVHVILEPGEAVGWQTGYLRAKVLDIIDSQGINAIVMDASVSAHMPDCIEMPYKPVIQGATDAEETLRAGSHKSTSYRVGGMTCLAGDFVGDYNFKNGLNIGDDLIFNDMIHYTMVKTTTFNGVNLPSIGIWKEDNYFRLVREYGYESYKDRLS
jgi:carboxynorspermidine decarboxylase